MRANVPIRRRTFLKTAAACAGLPYVALAQPDRRPALDRITLGLIGCGNMCNLHLPGVLRHPELQIVAVCDVKAWQRDAVRDKVETHYAEAQRDGHYDGVASYNEYEQVLARNDIDAVLIAVPDHWHAAIAIAACRAGKDVYCEKPLSLTVREAGAMVAAARRYGTVFQTGSQQRSDERFRRACELVRSGYIGAVRQVNVGVDGPSQPAWLPAEPVPDGLDWDRWLGPTPWRAYHPERCSGSFGGGWRLIRDYSGGMMTDWGAHHFDIAQWGLGRDGSGPVEIVPPELSERGLLTYRYADGVVMFRGNANGILFTGSEGKVEVNRGYLRTWPAALERVKLTPDDVHLPHSTDHRDNWVQAVRRRTRPLADVAIGASSATVCHLGNIACWTGRRLEWDPERRELLNDPLAARWLDRPRRAPYALHGTGGAA
jgi:predicted dehydrogenase